MFIDIKGDLPEGTFKTIIPSIDKNPHIPFIVWTPNGPYLQCTSNEEVLDSFMAQVVSNFSDINLSGTPISNQSQQSFCENMLDIIDKNNCVGVIHWIEPNTEMIISKDKLLNVIKGEGSMNDFGINKNFPPWKEREGTAECSGYLIVPKGKPGVHTYNLSLGGLSLIVHRHHDNAVQHAKVIEKTTIVNNHGSELHVAGMSYDTKYEYMSFILKILNKRKANGIWVWNHKGDGYFMPKIDVFKGISKDWLNEKIS